MIATCRSRMPGRPDTIRTAAPPSTSTLWERSFDRECPAP
jgi:hypothetical protein